MKKLVLSVLACVAPMCHAGLIGTTVTGVINFNGGGPNYYDPANSFVPSSGYQNSASNFDSPTVTIVGGNEFGFDDSFNLDVTSFSDTGFTFTDTSAGGSSASITLTFTDTAFTGVTELDSAFSGLTYGIAGDVITVDIPTFDTTPGNALSASFDVASASTVPEPSSFALLGIGVVGLAGLRQRMNLARVKAARR